VTRGRLTLINSVVIAAAAALIAVSVVVSHQLRTQRAIDDLLRQHADAAVAAAAKQTTATLNVDPFGVPSVYVQIVDTAGAVLDRSSNLGAQQLPVDPEQQRGALAGNPMFATTDIEGHSWRVYLARASGPTTDSVTLIQTATRLDDDLQPDLPVFAIGGVLGLLIAVAIGWQLARVALEPVERLAATVRTISSTDDLAQRVPADVAAWPGPVGTLAADVNAMLGRLQVAARGLQATLEAQRRFVSDAGHELRTPLTSIRGNAQLLRRWLAEQHRPAGEVPYDEVLNDLTLEAERMTRLVEGLLVLARADAEQHLTLVPTLLTPVLTAAIRSARWLAEDVDLSADDLSPGVWVQADTDRLEQVVLILLENAIRYSPAGGQVLLTSAPRDRDARAGVAIEVTDSGRGVPPSERSRIFERFYRSESTRRDAPGTGLGLAVARWIVTEHHGAIDVRDALPSGSTFSIWLPTVAPP
jgi:signal transduction histidine kinase